MPDNDYQEGFLTLFEMLTEYVGATVGVDIVGGIANPQYFELFGAMGDSLDVLAGYSDLYEKAKPEQED